MSKLMKCFVMHGIGKVGVMEKPVPTPGTRRRHNPHDRRWNDG